jgi:hypothetical protein
MRATFAIVNGPLMGKGVTLHGRLYRAVLPDGRSLDHVEIDEGVFLDSGLSLMMVAGSTWQFTAGEAMVLLTHPDWPTTLVNLETGVVHPCELVRRHQRHQA